MCLSQSTVYALDLQRSSTSLCFEALEELSSGFYAIVESLPEGFRPRRKVLPVDTPESDNCAFVKAILQRIDARIVQSGSRIAGQWSNLRPCSRLPGERLAAAWVAAQI